MPPLCFLFAAAGMISTPDTGRIPTPTGMISTPDTGRIPTPAVLRRFEAEFLRPYRGMILLGLLGLLIQSLMLLPIPLLQGWVVDRLVAYCQVDGRALSSESPSTTISVMAPASSGPSRSSIIRAIAAAFAATIALLGARTILAWRIAAMMGRISQEVVVALRGALHRKLMRLPMAYFDAQQTGRLMARVTSDVGSILMFIRSGILQLLNDLDPVDGHRGPARLAPVASGPGRLGGRPTVRP